MTDDQTFAVTLVLLATVILLPTAALGISILGMIKLQQRALAGYRVIQILGIALVPPLVAFLAVNELINEQAITTLLGVLVGYVFSLRAEPLTRGSNVGSKPS